MKDLVTLIAPCYNGEKYIERFLKSVLAQTYKNIQFILVNDGSTDNTERIINSYKNDLEANFTEFIYIKQDNNGAASAVCNALKYVKGEYLAWADVDDILHEDNILLKVNYLKDHPTDGMVLCAAQSIDENTNTLIRPYSYDENNKQRYIFDKLIFGGILCFSGVFMIRTELLFRRLKNKEIYWEKEVGQNWQLLLPVAYDNSCGYIDDILYDYYVRSDSHSHNVDYDRTIKRTYAQERVLKKILEFVEDNERQDLFKKIEQKYVLQRINLCIAEGRFEEYGMYYKELKNMGRDINLSCKERLRYSIMGNKITRKVYNALAKCRRIVN